MKSGQVINLFKESNSILEAYFKLYTLACHQMQSCYVKLADFFEDIEKLNSVFDKCVQDSYSVIDYPTSVRSLVFRLQAVANEYQYDKRTHQLIIDLYEVIEQESENWDYIPYLTMYKEMGRELARDFYQAGGYKTNTDLAQSEDPPIILSNVSLSEGISPAKPMITTSRGIELTYSEKHTFNHYLSLPIMFFHEFVSHIFLPNIDCRSFEDGWLVYAIDHFLHKNWIELSKKYGLYSYHMGLLHDFWIPKFGGKERKSFFDANKVQILVGSEKFLKFIWELTSYHPKYFGTLSIHHEFIECTKNYIETGSNDLLIQASIEADCVRELMVKLGCCK